MRTLLLLGALVLIASPAHAIVTCGKNWITFPGTHVVPKAEKYRKSADDFWYKTNGTFTFRKSRFDRIVVLNDISPRSGEIIMSGMSGSYFVRGQDYYEVIGCLD